MSGEIGTALMLMGVGMITVFIVLLLVVLVGNSLIVLVNRYVPEAIQRSSDSTPNISAEKIAAITAAVDIQTKGRGKITAIERID